MELFLRDVPTELAEWIRTTRPPGVTQNEFLLTLLRSAQNIGVTLDLFSDAQPPRSIYSGVPFKFIDLFAGIGGFRIGMTAVGGDCVFTSEWDKYAAKTYMEWFKDEVFSEDIRLLNPSDVPDHDVLCAGFPCQPFSLAGVSKKKSLGRSHGFDDEKHGNLFFTIMDIVDAKRPPVLFLENVKNLKSHDKGNTWRTIEQNLVDRNYAIFSKVIDARQWVPQHRERVFIVCFDKEIFGNEHQIGFQFPEGPGGGTLQDILVSSAPDRKYQLSNKLWQYLKDYAAKHKAKGNGFGYSLFTGADVARTLSARYHKDGSEILISQKGWRNPRRLTPKEAAKLMGYDNGYSEMWNHGHEFPQVVSDTQAYRQFGNSVVPKIVEAIGQNIIQVLAGNIAKTGNGCLFKDRGYAQYGGRA